MPMRLTRPSVTWATSSVKGSIAASSRCMAALVKTALCRVLWSCWAFPTPAPASWRLAISMDKVMTKRIWRFEGLPTPAWSQVSSAGQTRKAFAELGAPMIVKPAREGSSIGFTKVMTVDQCDAAYASGRCQARLRGAVRAVHRAGDEVTCPVLGANDSPKALPLIRIVAPDGNYDYQNKYFTDVVQYLVPAGLPAGEEEAIAGAWCARRTRCWAAAAGHAQM